MGVKVIDAANADTVSKKATFAGGCFWGLELAFQRAEGVISTKVCSATSRAYGLFHRLPLEQGPMLQF